MKATIQVDSFSDNGGYDQVYQRETKSNAGVSICDICGEIIEDGKVLHTPSAWNGEEEFCCDCYKGGRVATFYSNLCRSKQEFDRCYLPISNQYKTICK